MGRLLTITDSNETKFGIRKSAIKKDFMIGPNAIKFVTVAVFAVLALVYLTMSTAGANQGVEISELNNTQTNLELQKERMEAEVTRLKALSTIDEEFKKVELEPVSQVEHIAPDNRDLAKT